MGMYLTDKERFCGYSERALSRLTGNKEIVGKVLNSELEKVESRIKYLKSWQKASDVPTCSIDKELAELRIKRTELKAGE